MPFWKKIISGFVLGAAGAAAQADDLKVPTDFSGLTEMAYEHLTALQSAHDASWGISNADRFEVDLDAGIITWIFPDMQVTAPAELLGTWNPADQSFLWGWDHPSAPAGSAVASLAVKGYADQHGIAQLQTSKPSCDFDECWKIVATAALVGDLQGIYRAEAAPNGPWAYIGFGDVKLQKRD